MKCSGCGRDIDVCLESWWTVGDDPFCNDCGNASPSLSKFGASFLGRLRRK